MWIQVLQSFTLNGSLKIATGVALPTLLMIATVAAGASTGQASPDEKEVSRLVAQGAFFGLVIALVTSSLTNIGDRSTLDKNRVAYLRFGKQSVALGKVSGATLQFVIQIALTYIGVVVVAAIGKLDLSGLNAAKIVVYFVAFALYYTMVQTGTRYILAAFSNTGTRILALCGWGTVTIILYLVTAIANIANETGILTFFVKNMQWICFIPFLNVGLIDVMNGNRVEVVTSLTEKPDTWNQIWPVLIVAAECLILCLIAWKPFSGKLKTYLTV